MEATTTDTQPYTLVTIDSFAAKLFAAFQAQLQVVFSCVKDLKRMGKTKAVPAKQEDEDYTDESGDDE